MCRNMIQCKSGRRLERFHTSHPPFNSLNSFNRLLTSICISRMRHSFPNLVQVDRVIRRSNWELVFRYFSRLFVYFAQNLILIFCLSVMQKVLDIFSVISFPNLPTPYFKQSASFRSMSISQKRKDIFLQRMLRITKKFLFLAFRSL